jgi:adenylate kinase family enzyme
MELISPDWRGRVSDDELQETIEKALAGARVIWDNLPRTLQRVQVEEIRAEVSGESTPDEEAGSQ